MAQHVQKGDSAKAGFMQQAIRMKHLLFFCLPFLLVLNALCIVVFLLLAEKYELAVDVSGPVDIRVMEDLPVRASLSDPLFVDIDKEISLPLKMDLNLPIDTQFQVKAVVPIDMIIPLHVTLNQDNMRVENLMIPFDSDVFIDEVITVETIIPLDTTVRTLANIPVKVKADVPVKLDIPIRQNVRINQLIPVSLKNFSIPIKMDVPVKTEIHFNQPIAVKAAVPVSFDQVFTIPFKQQFEVPAGFKINANVLMDDATSVHIDELKISLDSLSVKKR